MCIGVVHTRLLISTDMQQVLFGKLLLLPWHLAYKVTPQDQECFVGAHAQFWVAHRCLL